MVDEKIDHTHPLFLHPSDTPSSVLIPIQLTGSENYGLWRRTIRIALQVKRKLGGIAYASDVHLVWEDLKERFDKGNRVRIFQLHREIATISQGTDYVDSYFMRLKEMRLAYDALVPTPGCDYAKSKDYIEHLHRQRLLQFLSGLNETYEQARRQILMKTF
ncbi:uncharacterized protein LOC142169849 [Nicotiana tabacum]|uniref:Uncharacterized protein LOC142169849 n=1 Tax=Nicotiana tabacum TaxID=4097 RepID=A0AC58SSB3_TOBAC